MSNNVVTELAPTGILRAAISLANFLLVSSRADNGDPQGVAPDLAAAIADSLGVGVSYVSTSNPGIMPHHEMEMSPSGQSVAKNEISGDRTTAESSICCVSVC